MRDKTTLFYRSSRFHFFYLKYRILTNSKPWVVPSVKCSDSNISGFFGIGGINYFLHDLLFSQLLTESNNHPFVWLSCPWWKTRCRICSRFRKITSILVRNFSKGNPGRLADKLHLQLKNLLASVKTVSWISWLKSIQRLNPNEKCVRIMSDCVLSIHQQHCIWIASGGFIWK